MIKSDVVNDAIDFILAHAGEDICVDDIARHCHFSRFHFSRLFKAETGESVYEFIKRVKLERSAFRLKVEKERKITEIGSDYGYSSSNYSSAFRQHHKLSPAEFRKSIADRSMVNPLYENNYFPLKSFGECEKLITIELLPDYPVICQRYKGSYRALSKQWKHFLNEYERYITDQSLLLECSYDDPVITSQNDCLCDLFISCPKVDAEYSEKSAPRYSTLKGGQFAVYHFMGAVAELYTAYQNVFQVWLPNSGYTIDNRYGLSIYRYVDCETMEMEIDLCIPIAKR